MLQVKEHIITKGLVVLLAIVLVTPLFVKSFHVFEDHIHEVCKTPYTNHYHEYEIDCEFYDFTLNTNFCQSLDSYQIREASDIFKKINSQYHFISDYQQLHFSLRGPPLSV